VSGIVGILNLDRAPVDPRLLEEMTQHMAFRGPDAQETWIDCHVGLGHAMLRTTFEMAQEQQPRSLDGRVWITADARIDAREELVRKLEANSCRALARAGDADLILHAYRVWDTGCVNHLLGDFSFAIWDVSRQRLFCARDHFGIRPFYYALAGKSLIFSNDLDTVRQHPAVSDKLNDLAMINFLLFRYQPRIDQTSFADIQSLLPAHTLLWEGQRRTISRFWLLPIEDPIHHKCHHDYVDQFRELLDTAVADRMRTDRAGILMSGGMDSSSIAATIHHLRVLKKSKFNLKAFTYVYDRLIPDEERRYATLIANHLDIPIHFQVLDDRKWFDGWDREGFRFPEPMMNSPLWNDEDCVRKAALNDGLRVFYSGIGPDSTLNEPTSYGALLRHGYLGEFIRQAGSFIMRYRQRPRAGAARFWQRLRGTIPQRRVEADALALLAPRIAEQIEVPKGWWQFLSSPQIHPWRPSAYSRLTDHYCTLVFQGEDAANWQAPIEFRYPYFDVRLVRYLLRVPVLPWSANKGLLREAMRGRLPKRVCLRPKAPVPGDPQHSYADWVQSNDRAAPQLARYVDADRALRLLRESARIDGVTVVQQLIALNHWLQSYNQQALQEITHGEEKGGVPTASSASETIPKA
jgi:asparagine synthase (glutamine-hydrolysing)